MRRLSGVYCAAFTAFAGDGEVDSARTARHARALLSQGCDGVALLGTTGEANSLSLAERRAVLEAAIGGGVAPDRLLPGTSTCAVPDTIALTRHARECGVGAVLLLPPFYYPGPSEVGLFDFYARVIDGCGDDGLRVLLYHIPQMTGVPITRGLIAALLDRFPGMIAGVKDSGGDLAHMQALVAAFPELSIFAGADHLAGPLVRAGGAGCITATSNLIAPMLADLFARIAAGEATEALERRIGETRALFQQWPQIPALKAAKALMTREPGWANLRPPMRPLDPRQTAELAAAMEMHELMSLTDPSAERV